MIRITDYDAEGKLIIGISFFSSRFVSTEFNTPLLLIHKDDSTSEVPILNKGGRMTIELNEEIA